MTHIRMKLIVGGLALAVAVTLLAMAGVKDGWVYYLPVDEFVTSTDYRDQRVRLHGTVGAENLDSKPALLLARFDLVGETQHLRIEYGGVVPDMFQADRDVVVEGQLDESGVFKADTLLTKCASKYEMADGQTPHSDPTARESSE